MKPRSRGRAPTERHPRNGCAEQGGQAHQGDKQFPSPKQQEGHRAQRSTRLFNSIFGKEKVERLLSAIHFSCGDTSLRRPAGRRPQIKRIGLLLVLLFLQSLFIAIDYLPVTLEILSRNHACTYTPLPQDKSKDRPTDE